MCVSVANNYGTGSRAWRLPDSRAARGLVAPLGSYIGSGWWAGCWEGVQE